MNYIGTEIIHFNFLKPSNILKLHCKSPLVLSRIALSSTKENLLFTEQPFDTIEIFFTEFIEGEFDLEIDFIGSINQDSVGCFMSERNNSKMISTEFEPTHAREALPLLDEPCFKSKFNLKVTVEKGWTVISNMPGNTETTGDSMTATFNTTPSMSCYLLHWTICKHEKITTTLNNTEISLYAADTSFSGDSLQLAKEALEYYNVAFSIPYPLPKMDLISIFCNI